MGAALCDRVCKPGSVLTAIYLVPSLPAGSSHLLGTAGPASCPTHGVAPDRVYSGPMSPWAGCALTAPFHPYRVGTSSISFALPQAAKLTHFAVPPFPNGTDVPLGPHFWGSGTSSISFALPQAAKLTHFAVPLFPRRNLRSGGAPIMGARRYLSVALVLGSPPAGVTRYPCPAEPGLSSRGAFRPPPAAVRPGRLDIVTDSRKIVKYLAKSFFASYTIGESFFQ